MGSTSLQVISQKQSYMNKWLCKKVGENVLLILGKMFYNLTNAKRVSEER